MPRRVCDENPTGHTCWVNGYIVGGVFGVEGGIHPTYRLQTAENVVGWVFIAGERRGSD